MKYRLTRYQDAQGHVPFSRWLNGLRDLKAVAQILLRLNRAAEGYLGDRNHLRDGVWEMRLHSGPGYRLYYGFSGREKLLLLNGGDKSSQQSDINKAISYWQDQQLRKHHEK